MGLIRIFLIIGVLYYSFKFLVRLFAPYLMKKAVDMMEQKTKNQYKQQEPDSNVKVGETVIDKKPNAAGHNDKPVGEYIDFEEID